MPTITIYVPVEVYQKYKADRNRKRGFLARMVADYYGMTIAKTRVVPKP